MWYVRGGGKCIRNLVGKPEEKSHLEDLGVNGG